VWLKGVGISQLLLDRPAFRGAHLVPPRVQFLGAIRLLILGELSPCEYSSYPQLADEAAITVNGNLTHAGLQSGSVAATAAWYVATEIWAAASITP
jgi:hypothetical protein